MSTYSVLGSGEHLGRGEGAVRSQVPGENAGGVVRLSPGLRTKSRPETVCSLYFGSYRQGFGKTDLHWDFRAKGALSAQRCGGSRWPPWWPRGRRESVGQDRGLMLRVERMAVVQ